MRCVEKIIVGKYKNYFTPPVRIMLNKEKYIKDIDSLIKRGISLRRGLYNELKDKYKVAFAKLSDEDRKLILNSKFKEDYHSWYNESLALIKQLMPERLEDFVSLYRLPKRKNTEISYLTYTIYDYMLGLVVNDGLGNVKVDGMHKINQLKRILVSMTITSY